MSTRAESLTTTTPKIIPTSKRVVAALFMRQLTRAQIADATGLRLSSVCGRVNELITAGKAVVVGLAWDEQTRRNVERISLV